MTHEKGPGTVLSIANCSPRLWRQSWPGCAPASILGHERNKARRLSLAWSRLARKAGVFCHERHRAAFSYLSWKRASLHRFCLRPNRPARRCSTPESSGYPSANCGEIRASLLADWAWLRPAAGRTFQVYLKGTPAQQRTSGGACIQIVEARLCVPFENNTAIGEVADKSMVYSEIATLLCLK